MRIVEARLIDKGIERSIILLFDQDDGIRGSITVTVPDPYPSSWKEWAVVQVEAYLLTNRHALPYTVIWPDKSKTVSGKIEFDNMPGWADWTGQQAADWIDANVADLASVKTTLKSMSRAITYLRDIIIER